MSGGGRTPACCAVHAALHGLRRVGAPGLQFGLLFGWLHGGLRDALVWTQEATGSTCRFVATAFSGYFGRDYALMSVSNRMALEGRVPPAQSGPACSGSNGGSGLSPGHNRVAVG